MSVGCRELGNRVSSNMRVYETEMAAHGELEHQAIVVPRTRFMTAI
jgi:hypothetical protein